MSQAGSGVDGETDSEAGSALVWDRECDGSRTLMSVMAAGPLLFTQAARGESASTHSSTVVGVGTVRWLAVSARLSLCHAMPLSYSVSLSMSLCLTVSLCHSGSVTRAHHSAELHRKIEGSELRVTRSVFRVCTHPVLHIGIASLSVPLSLLMGQVWISADALCG